MDNTIHPTLRRPGGMTGFVIVWIGQIISILASGMSGFGLSIWMFQQTQSATAMGLIFDPVPHRGGDGGPLQP
jgi:hypothetical protein